MFRVSFRNLCSSSSSSSTTKSAAASSSSATEFVKKTTATSTVYTSSATIPDAEANSTSSSSSSTTTKTQQKLVAPKDENFKQENGFNHKFSKYMSYRDPNNRHLKVSRLLFEKHKGIIGMSIGIGVVIAATVAEQWEHFDEMKHNLPMKLDGRSLVI